MRNNRHRVVHVLIGVGDPGDVCVVVGNVPIVVGDIRVVVVYYRGVINVRHLGYIDAGVGDVHIVYVLATSSIGRNEHFSRSQREPGYTNAESASADECHQRWGVYRTRVNRTRHPAP
jgi:hypothetical protein